MPRDHVQSAFLGVESSLTGRRWLGPSVEEARLAEALAQSARLPDPVAQVLSRRGVAPDRAADFLAPSLRALLPDPRSLRDMGRAADRFRRAAEESERIAVFADYDVDGGASAALLIAWLRDLGRRATLYVPDRIAEGYGPNAAAMERLAAEHDLIVCVDCGTLAHKAIAAAGGTDVIVLDHHLGGETLPPAHAVVNPNRQDEASGLGHLCAAAVVFLLLVEVTRQRRAAGHSGPDLRASLDLVALATVADVVPLTGVNRALVRQGLTVMARRARPGIARLADGARLDGAPTARHLGFVLGPRINAGGRIGAAELGARLLATADEHEAAALAERLDRLNTERREVEARVRAAALDQAEARGLDAPLVWAAGEGWHPGVVGIVAARLTEATGRPAVVLGLANGAAKGSGRSVAGVDLGAAVQRLVAEGALSGGGGHPMAAGLSVAERDLEPAMDRLSALLARQGAGVAAPAELHLDGLLMSGAVTVSLLEQLETAGPFGAGAPPPRFAIADAEFVAFRRVGESHLKLSVRDATGARLEAMAFGAYEGSLGPRIEAQRGARLHLAGRLQMDRWRGSSRVLLCIDDAARPDAAA